MPHADPEDVYTDCPGSSGPEPERQCADARCGQYRQETEDTVLGGSPDFVIDAIDNIDTKVRPCSRTYDAGGNLAGRFHVYLPHHTWHAYVHDACLNSCSHDAWKTLLRRCICWQRACVAGSRCCAAAARAARRTPPRCAWATWRRAWRTRCAVPCERGSSGTTTSPPACLCYCPQKGNGKKICPTSVVSGAAVERQLVKCQAEFGTPAGRLLTRPLTRAPPGGSAESSSSAPVLTSPRPPCPPALPARPGLGDGDGLSQSLETLEDPLQ